MYHLKVWQHVSVRFLYFLRLTCQLKRQDSWHSILVKVGNLKGWPWLMPLFVCPSPRVPMRVRRRGWCAGRTVRTLQMAADWTWAPLWTIVKEAVKMGVGGGGGGDQLDRSPLSQWSSHKSSRRGGGGGKGSYTSCILFPHIPGTFTIVMDPLWVVFSETQSWNFDKQTLHKTTFSFKIYLPSRWVSVIIYDGNWTDDPATILLSGVTERHPITQGNWTSLRRPLLAPVQYLLPSITPRDWSSVGE